MADQTEQAPVRKRRVKNPETFRQKATKAAEAAERPSRKGRIWSGFKRVIKKVFSPIGRGLKKLFSVQPFKTIAKIGRWIGLVVWPPYFRNSFKELKKVTWPTWKDSLKLTYAVLVFSVLFGVIIAVVDYGLDKLFRNILLK